MVVKIGVELDNNKLILVCDDVADNCLFLQTVLEIEGYSVDIVESGVAALTYLESKLPDLLLLDVMMPQMDGYEVVRRIRNNPVLQLLTIFFITAHDEVFFRKESDVKVDGIIRKPVDINVLIKSIQAALRQPHHF